MFPEMRNLLAIELRSFTADEKYLDKVSK